MLEERRVEGVVKMDLKVCERCGALWCRVLGEKGRYCDKCVRALARAEKPVNSKSVKGVR